MPGRTRGSSSAASRPLGPPCPARSIKAQPPAAGALPGEWERVAGALGLEPASSYAR